MRKITLLKLSIFFFLCTNVLFSQGKLQDFKHVLYIHSYAPGYSWGDNITKGVLKTFDSQHHILTYIEYLDAKRFGDEYFNLLFELIHKKYKDLNIELIMVSDNKALDFLMLYGDSINPDIPVIFCGVNNLDEYDFSNTRFYGIKEGVSQDSSTQLILKVLPEVKKLYFITDSTPTSLSYLKQIRLIEPKYKDILEFEYVQNISVDSILKLVSTLPKGGAIARIDLFHDIDKKHINFELVSQKIAQNSTIPVFMDAESLFGKGILGGMINKGEVHGKQMAELAINFLHDKSFKPDRRIFIPESKPYFDFKILKKYGINQKQLPENSIIINKPVSVFSKYQKYFIITGVIFLFLSLIIVVLFINIKRRIKAESTTKLKLEEIKVQNMQLENMHDIVSDMNTELEETNAKLQMSNSELKIAKTKAEESDRLKSAFLSNMSHEIRTPMNAIVGFASLITSSEYNITEKERFFDLINKSSKQLLTLIDDILDLSKSDANMLKINKSTVYVNEVLKELKSIFSPQIESSKLSLKISNQTNDENLSILTDPVRLKQILNNLVANAIKFTEKGFVEIGCQLNNNEFIFYVKDTGIGIDSKHFENIFSRFWKLNGIKTKLYAGTGLGLAISKNLAELLDAKIWVESNSEQGSVFYLSFDKNIILNNKSKEISNINQKKY